MFSRFAIYASMNYADETSMNSFKYHVSIVTLDRLRTNGNPEEKGLSICLIKSFRASMKRGIRAIILACRNLDSATRMFVSHLLAVSISAPRSSHLVLSLASP